MIGCLSYIGLRKKYPDMNRPYKAPMGIVGCCFTIVVYGFILVFAERTALFTAGVVTAACILFCFFYSYNKEYHVPSIEDEIGIIEEPDQLTKEKMDKEYRIWKIGTIVVTVIALGIYIIPIFF
jgi:APA family basic amino acid/polyamine antiporter